MKCHEQSWLNGFTKGARMKSRLEIFNLDFSRAYCLLHMASDKHTRTTIIRIKLHTSKAN